MDAMGEKEGTTDLQREYTEFFSELVDRLRSEISAPLPAPEPQNKYLFPAGLPGAHFKWGFTGRSRSPFTAGLHFCSKNRDTKLMRLREMGKLRHEIEERTGEKVVFEPEATEREARLYIQKNEGRMTEELRKWAVEKMVILYNLLQPELEKLR